MEEQAANGNRVRTARLLEEEAARLRGVENELRESRERTTELEVANRDLQARNELLNAIIEGADDPIFAKDRETRALVANTACKKVLRKTGPEIIGKTNTEVLPTGAAEEISEQDRLIMETGATEVFEQTTVVDGVLRTYLTRKAPLRDAGGTVVGVLGIARDITDRKRAEEELKEGEERYRSFVQNFAGIAFRGRLDFTPIFFHGAVEQITGYTEEALVAGSPRWDQVIHPDDLHLKMKQGPALRSVPGYGCELDYRIVRKDREVRWVHEYIQNVCDDQGTPAFVQGTLYDITARKQGEEALQKANDLLTAVSRVQGAFIAHRDPRGLFEELLDILLELTDSEYGFIGEVLYDSEGRPYLKTHALTNIAWSEETRAFYAKEAPDGMEFRNLGTLFGPVIATGRPVIANDPIHDPRRGGLPHGHPALHAFTGLPLHYGKQLSGMVGLANRPGGYDSELSTFLEPVLTTCSGIIDAVRSEQRRRLSEEGLRKSEERYRGLVEDMPALVCRFVPDGTLTFVNSSYCSYFHREPEELIGSNFFSFVPEPEREEVRAHFKSLNKARPAVTYEHQAVSPQGSVRWQEWTGRSLFDEGGEPVEFQSLGRDVTERKSAERALADSERRFRSIFNNAAVGAALVDKDGRVVDANEADCNFLGYAKQELLGMHFTEFTHADDLALDQQLYESLLRGERDGYTIDKRYVRKDGDVVWGRLGVSLILDDAGDPQYTVIVCEDITERKRAEEDRRRLEAQIQHAQKLESLGVLAGGIAHDFNNLLMGVLGNADLALATMTPETPGRQYLQKIETAGRRAAELTNQMLAYSGKGRFLVERIQLNRAVEEMAHLLSTVISKKATLKFHFTQNLPTIAADASQIRQVVMNLITNASEAIGDAGGVIGLSTGVVEADSRYLSETYLDDELPEGEYVYLEVSDSGSGMDEETRQKIFDPFFTTKFTGRGLGLAAVLGIVRGHKGALKVYSEPGRGTSFKVLFPRSGDAPVAAEREPEPAEAARPGTTVLIVDDDEDVLDVAKTMLQKSGYTVLTAVDGRRGVELYRQHAGEIDLVLLDMTMPQMGGEEAFGELRRIRSDVRVILSSGYSEQDATSRFAGKGLAGFLQKPYRSAKLLGKVREALA